MRGGLAGPLSPRPRTGVRSVVHRGHTPSRASQLLAAPRRANCRARPGAGRGRAGSAGGDRTTDDASPRPLGRVRNVQTTERVADPARGARARARTACPDGLVVPCPFTRKVTWPSVLTVCAKWAALIMFIMALTAAARPGTSNIHRCRLSRAAEGPPSYCMARARAPVGVAYTQ